MSRLIDSKRDARAEFGKNYEMLSTGFILLNVIISRTDFFKTCFRSIGTTVKKIVGKVMR
jgi:hypothetical protein